MQLKENRKVEQIGEEGAQSNDWERIGKSEGAKRERKFKNQAQKTNIQQETQEPYKQSINSTDQNTPRGQDACGTTTTH